MPGWCIVLLVLLLILMIPVGVDAAYSPQEYFVKLKLGPFRKTVLPGGEKKRKKKKPGTEAAEAKPEKSGKKKLKLTFDDILSLAEIALRALRRFGAHLSVDRLTLNWTAAAADPYDAVLQYGRVNAALGALAGPAHRVFHIREEDVRTELDLTVDRPVIDARLILTIQIWEILLIAVCAGASGLRWYLNKKRTERAAAGGRARKELV